MQLYEKQYRLLTEELDAKGIDIQNVKERLKKQVIELPSWAVGNSGTRYGTFKQQGAASNIWQKIDDCAEIQRCLGITPVMASHTCWDKSEDGRFTPVKDYASEKGISIGTVHPNTFSGQEFRLGSICSPIKEVRVKTHEHFKQCIEIARDMGSKSIGLWLADGTNYPGQDSLRERKHRLIEGLQILYGALDEDMTLLIEYKPFEPFFYTSDINDWGMSYLLCQKLGPQAKVLVDLGHHVSGVNVEQIIANLLDENRLGGFHLNNRRYADDDLIVGTVNPLEVFLIFKEIVDFGIDHASNIIYMLDQSHNIENSLAAIIYSVMNVQSAYAKALILEREALAKAQADDDIVLSNKIVMDAFNTNVEPLLAVIRLELGLADIDPLRNFRNGAYLEKIAERAGGMLTLGGGC